MAQLKDSLISGDLRVTGTIYGDVPLDDLTGADDLKAIEALTGTSGVLTKTAANTWELSDQVSGKVGTTANYAVYTTTGGALTAGSFALSDPTASGNGITYIATISQDSKGQISATKSTVRDASDSQSGVVSTGAQTFAGNKTLKGHLYPQADSTYDIGSTSLHWRYQYLDSLYVSTDTGYTATNSAKIGTSLTAGYIDLTNATPTIRLHRGTAAAITGNIISDTYAGIHITGTAGTENTTYASRSIKPLVRMDGLVYSNNNIEAAGYFLNNVSAAGNGYYNYGNNVQYGRMYIETIGKASTTTTYVNPEDDTQTVTGYTGGAQGWMTLELGNNKTGGTNGSGYSSPGSASTADNARGRLRIWSTNNKYIDIIAQTNGNRTVYLPNYGGDMYLTHTANNNKVGDTNQPVYVAANGRISAITGAIANNTTGSAATLTTAREIYVDLSSTRNTSSKVTFNGGADKAIHVSGTLPVARGGTGLTTSSYVNAVLIGNASTATNAFRTIRTGSGAFYATAQDGAPSFGTLPVAQGGTGQTSIANIQAGKDGDGNTISSTYLKLAGGTMTGTLTLKADPTANLQAATKQYVDQSFAANDAMIFKGTLGTGGTVTALPNTHNAGWTYRVITAGTYAGIACEIGDLIICITDGTAANNAHWTVAQTNIDGAVTGPTSGSVVGNQIAVFNGTTGKIIKGGSIGDHTYTPAGTVSVSTNATTNKTATVSTTSGTATYTPAGTITVNGTTSTATVVKTATFNTVVIGASVANEILTISTGASGSSTNQTDVRIADPAYTFTGTGVRLVTGNIAVPNTYTATFSGTQATLTHSVS